MAWPLVTIETSDLLALGVDKMAHQARLVFRKLEQFRDVVVFIDEVEEMGDGSRLTAGRSRRHGNGGDEDKRREARRAEGPAPDVPASR